MLRIFFSFLCQWLPIFQDFLSEPDVLYSAQRIHDLRNCFPHTELFRVRLAVKVTVLVINTVEKWRRTANTKITQNTATRVANVNKK